MKPKLRAILKIFENKIFFYLISFSICLYFCLPFLATRDNLGLYDWDQHLFYYGSVFKSLYEYGQAPFWNPWYCGGNVLWSNPQVALLSPTYVFALFVSIPFAMKFNIFLHYFLSFVGMERILTDLVKIKFSPIVIFLSALFSFSGALTMHIAQGHSTFLPFFYLPLFFYFLMKSILENKPLHLILASTVAALMLYNAGMLAFLYSFFGMGLLGVFSVFTLRSFKPLLSVFYCGVLSFFISAPKLLPTLLFLKDERAIDSRLLVQRDPYTFEWIYESLLGTHQQGFYRNLPSWHEIGNYIGWFGLLLISVSLLAIIALTACRKKYHGLLAALALVTILLFVISLGDIFPYSPYYILTHLPVFEKTRRSGRFLIVTTFFAVILVSYAWRHLLPTFLKNSKIFNVLLAILCVHMTLDLMYVNRRHYKRMFAIENLHPVYARKGSETLRWDLTTDPYSSNSPMYHGLMEDKGVVNCYEPFGVKTSIDQTKTPLAFAENLRDLKQINFNPNKVDVFFEDKVKSKTAHFNQNYISGWNTKVEEGRVSFVFYPPGLNLGLILFVIGVFFCCFLLKFQTLFLIATQSSKILARQTF